MNIISEDQHEVLGFIEACNSQHYNPTADEVLLRFQNRAPREAKYRTVRQANSSGSWLHPAPPLPKGVFERIASSYGRTFQEHLNSTVGNWNILNAGITPQRETVEPAETIIDHMVRLTWLKECLAPDREMSGLHLTKLGQALLHHYASGAARQSDTDVVVFNKNDPLAYAQLIGFLAEQGPGLLIDPYLKLKDIKTIASHTQLTRLLVSGKVGGKVVNSKGANSSTLTQIAVYLSTEGLPRKIDIRSSTELHDRAILTNEGEVHTIGTSLNGIGRKTTTMVTMPPSAREHLRDDYERLWEEGSPIEAR